MGMTSSKDARAALSRHFEQVEPDSFRRRVEDNTGSDSPVPAVVTGSQLVLFQAPRALLPLTAYLASALSGLTADQRDHIFRLADLVAAACRELKIDLYQPSSSTDPIAHPHVVDTHVFQADREHVLESDLLIHLTHYPSTGSGEELDFALNAMLPVVLIRHSDQQISRMITGIPAVKVQVDYRSDNDLAVELKRTLISLRPILEQRKLAFADYDVNLVGAKIRLLRQGLDLTRDDVAAAIPGMTAELLTQIEDSTDRVGNPSLAQLRAVAAVLRTTVADIVEPDLTERLLAALQEWITPAARASQFGAMSLGDRNRLIRRLLLRVVDSLEEE